MNKLIVMGIDPGYRTGYCIWSGDKILKITTVSKDRMFDVLKQIKEDGLVSVVGIEVSTNTYIYPRKDKHGKPVNQAVMRNIAQNVGANRAEALRLVGIAMGLGFEVVQLEPKNTKMSPLLFQKITGYTKRCSSHARDAWGIARRTYAEVYFKSRIKE